VDGDHIVVTAGQGGQLQFERVEGEPVGA
jgi:hypothetical protein